MLNELLQKQPNPPSPSLGQYKLVKSTSTNPKKYIYIKLKQKSSSCKTLYMYCNILILSH